MKPFTSQIEFILWQHANDKPRLFSFLYYEENIRTTKNTKDAYGNIVKIGDFKVN